MGRDADRVRHDAARREQAPGFSMRIHEKSPGEATGHARRRHHRAGSPSPPRRTPSRQGRAPPCAARHRRAVAACAGDIDRAGGRCAAPPAPHPHVHRHVRPAPRAQAEHDARGVPGAATAAVVHARRYTDDVQFSAEDATRSDADFLCRGRAVIAAGARRSTCPTRRLLDARRDRGVLQAILAASPTPTSVFSTHCHNDLAGRANSLAAVGAGCASRVHDQRIGERAGNASLEEVAMVLRVRPDRHPYTRLEHARHLWHSQLLTN